MRIAVLGASGRSGRLVLDLLRARGHNTVAVVRASSAADLVGDVRRCDFLDASALAGAISGCDAVAFCVGPTGDGDTTVMQSTISATIAAMASAGINRLVTISATGPYTRGDDPFVRFIAKPILRRVFRETWADLAAAELVIRDSTVDWTIVRPSMLTDGPASRRPRLAIDRNRAFGIASTRADTANVVAAAIDTPEWIHHSVSVVR
jgi:uncharacterized protein YbjT (DUF2867 family)